jgi:hypothetical protein
MKNPGPEDLALSCPRRGLQGLSLVWEPAGVMEWWSNGLMIVQFEIRF